MTEFEKMLQLLDMAWLLRDQIVPCLVGPPGIGKTAAVEQHAKAHGCGKVVKIVASRCIPSETVGMTMPNHAKRSMDIYNSMQLSSLEDGDILFLDELLEADQYVLSTLLTVIESREMADGTPLPDIQIIAATNDTIPAEQLKGNIRQRFMFQRFKIDKDQTREYIEEKTGIHLRNEILRKLVDSGSDYNFLTPRSLTKLCLWMNKAKSVDKAMQLAATIDMMWNSDLGTYIFTAWKWKESSLRTPEEQVKQQVKDMIASDAIKRKDIPDSFDFEDCTIGELYYMLQGLPEWKEIAESLAKVEILEPEKKEVDIQF